MVKIKQCCGEEMAQEMEEMKKWQDNGEAIINKLQEKECKPFLGSIGLYLAIVTLISSSICVIIMHFTGMFDNMILGILALKEDGEVFNIWKQPSFPNYVNLYVFNYTNLEEFLEGNEKAKVEELGPYVFEERGMMTDIEFDGKQFLTYTENRTHRFMPERSYGSLNDTIFTPNIVYISAVSVLKSDGMVKQVSASLLLNTFQTKLFSEVTIGDYFFGFDDRFSTFARKVQTEQKNPEPFGLLAQRNGIGHDRITIGTGVPDVSKLGVVYKFNNRTELPWHGECSKIQASDGTIFPAEDVASGTIHAFATAICRRVPLLYEQEAVANGFPANRFMLPSNIFDSSSENPDNACFCQKDCPPSGGFMVSPCFFGSPVVISFPHFLHGSPKLRENFEGLQPDPEKHSFYLDVHEVGIPLGGHTRLQLNIMINHAKYMGHLKSLEDGLVLPFAWLDVEIGEMNGTARVLLWNVTYVVPFLKFVLKWVSLILVALMSYLLYRHYTQAKRRRTEDPKAEETL